jgi:hypothetical protein
LGDWADELPRLAEDGYDTLTSLEYPEHHDAG